MKKLALIGVFTLVFASFAYGYHGGGHYRDRGGHHHSGNGYYSYR